MLLRLLPAEKNQAEGKQIDGYSCSIIFYNFHPGLIHAAAPAYVIEYKNRIVANLWQKAFKIT